MTIPAMQTAQGHLCLYYTLYINPSGLKGKDELFWTCRCPLWRPTAIAQLQLGDEGLSEAIWGSNSNDGVGGNRDQRRNSRWLFFFFFFSSPQTFAELCSNVTLFICLSISDCQIVSSPKDWPCAPSACQCFSRKQSCADLVTGRTKPLTFYKCFWKLNWKRNYTPRARLKLKLIQSILQIFKIHFIIHTCSWDHKFSIFWVKAENWMC